MSVFLLEATIKLEKKKFFLLVIHETCEEYVLESQLGLTQL